MTATIPSSSDAGPGTGPPPWRLRDLDGREALVGLALVVLLLVPFAVSVGRALADGWVPSGDEATIAIQVHDVLTDDPPLTGLPSTSDLYGERISTQHPGPAEFYLLALPVRVLGPSVGMLGGAAVINAGSILIALWVVLRRAGPGIALTAGVLLSAVLWSAGTAVLSDPISSNIGGFPMLALAVLAWALACGDHRLLPLAAFVGSFAAQQHLAAVAPVAIIVIWGVGALGVRWLVQASSARRAGHSDDSTPDGGDSPGVVAPVEGTGPRRPRRWPWVVAAMVVAAVMWAPVAVDQITGDPGNITAVARFARDNDRPTLGFRSGATQVLRVVGLPPFLVRHDITGTMVVAPLSPLGVAAGAAMLATLVVSVAVAWRRRPGLAMLGATSMAVVAAGLVSGSSVPRALEAARINLYRWSFVLAFLAWLTAAWLAGLALRAAQSRASAPVGAHSRPTGWAVTTDVPRPGQWAARVGRPARVAVPLVALALVTVAVGVSVGTTGEDDIRRDDKVFAIDTRFGDAAVAAATEGEPVTVITDGAMASLAVGPAVVADLVDAGYHVQVPARRANTYGDHRSFDPDAGGTVLLLSSSLGPLPAGSEPPGRLLATGRIAPGPAAAIDRAVAAVRGGDAQARSNQPGGDPPAGGQPVVVSDRGPALLARYSDAELVLIRNALGQLATDPARALQSEAVIDLILDGYLTSPTFDPADLETIRAWIRTGEERTVWGEERVTMRELTMDELRAYRPQLFE